MTPVTVLTPRQMFALTHPLNRADDAINPAYYRDRPHKRIPGVLVRTMLAVDR